MARVYTLATMPKRDVATHSCVVPGGPPKARINATKDRRGYRVFQGKTYLGFFRVKKEAERFVREQNKDVGDIGGQDVAQDGSQQRSYRYVSSKTSGGKTVYYGTVRLQGTRDKKFFPWCESPREAASLVADFLQTKPHRIKLLKSERESAEKSADRTALLSALFEGWVPADLADAVVFRGKASSLQASGPAAYVAGLFGKEDRWRSGMLQVWDAMPMTERAKMQWLGSRDEDMARDGARALHDLLCLSFALWGGWAIPRLRSMSWPVDVRKEIAPPTPAKRAAVEEERQWWKLHVHRNVVHHLSLGPFALHMGIIQKTTTRRGSLLVGTDAGEHYSLKEFDVSEHMKSYQTLHVMGVLLNSMPIPHTNVEWAQVQVDVEAMADLVKLKRSQYHWPWLLRTYIYTEMRHHGVEELKVAKDWNAKELQTATRPDQNKWLSLWMSQLAGNSLKKLLRRLRFTESIEMLSIFACVLNDTTIMSYTLEQLTKHQDEIRMARQQMHEQYGKEASPVLVVKSVMERL